MPIDGKISHRERKSTTDMGICATYSAKKTIKWENAGNNVN